MVKAAGILMIMAAGALAGVMISKRATNRIQFFEQFLLYLNGLRGKLGYTLGELRTLLLSDEKMLSQMLKTMSGKLFDLGREGAAREAISMLPSSYGLKSEDKKLIYGFLSELGSSDCDSQLAHCELYISLVNGLLSSQREEAAKKSRLYRLLGVFSGIGAGLFFL